MIFRKTAAKKIEENLEKLQSELSNADWVMTEDNLGTKIWQSDEIQNHIKKLLIKGQEFHEQEKFVEAIPYFLIICMWLEPSSHEYKKIAERLVCISYFDLAQKENSEEYWEKASAMLHQWYNEYSRTTDYDDIYQNIGLRIKCLRHLNRNLEADNLDVLYQKGVSGIKRKYIYRNTPDGKAERQKLEEEKFRQMEEEVRQMEEKFRRDEEEKFRQAEETRRQSEEELRKQDVKFKEYYKAEEEFLKSKDYKPTEEEWDEFDKTWWNKEKYQKTEEEEDYRSKETQQKDPHPYEILGVTESTSLNEIKKKYRELILKNHPDKGGSEKRTKEITDAWYRIQQERNENPR